MRIERYHPLTSDINREIPIAPPSMNEFGSKNPFSPKPAETTPREIKTISLMVWVWINLRLFFFVGRLSVIIIDTCPKILILPLILSVRKQKQSLYLSQWPSGSVSICIVLADVDPDIYRDKVLHVLNHNLRQPHNYYIL